jgi:hypothetical protein
VRRGDAGWRNRLSIASEPNLADTGWMPCLRRTIQNLANTRVPLHWLESKRGENRGQNRSGNSCIKSRDQTTGTGTDAVTQCDHCLAGCQQQRSRDDSEALRSDFVRFITKKDRCGSEGTLGEVEGGTTEESGVTITQLLRGFGADPQIWTSQLKRSVTL